MFFITIKDVLNLMLFFAQNKPLFNTLLNKGLLYLLLTVAYSSAVFLSWAKIL